MAATRFARCESSPSSPPPLSWFLLSLPSSHLLLPSFVLLAVPSAELCGVAELGVGECGAERSPARSDLLPTFQRTLGCPSALRSAAALCEEDLQSPTARQPNDGALPSVQREWSSSLRHLQSRRLGGG